jgi:hypothetical protein
MAVFAGIAGIFVGCYVHPGYPSGVVSFELDYQANCDPFAIQGDPGAVESKFPTWCEPQFYFDDFNLPPTMILENGSAMWDYWREHAWMDIDIWGDSTPVYPFYLCGIDQFMAYNGTPIWTVYGATVPEQGAEPYSVFSLFCRDVVDITSDPDNMEVKTVCHELGHQLGHFIHLCDDYGNFNSSDHSDSTCLMGKDEMTCTNQSLLSYIHFCTMCRDSLGRIEGREVQGW